MQINDYIDALPDSYAKTSDSNNYKLLSIEQQSVQLLRDDMQALEDAQDIWKATGKTLDHYGKMYGQARGTMTDEQYRILILQRVARLFAGCDYVSVVTALATVLNVPFGSFYIKESGNSCVVELTSLPYEILQEFGITSEQVYDLVKSMLTVGVRLAPINLEGTFEFASKANEYDADAGFGDISQTIGGYLGLLQGDNVYAPDAGTTATIGVAVLGEMIL